MKFFCFSFDWFVPEDQLKERTLDITVKNDVSFFSKSKTSMGQVMALKNCVCKIYTFEAFLGLLHLSVTWILKASLRFNQQLHFSLLSITAADL